MKPKSTISLMMTFVLAVLLVSAAQADVYAPQAPAPAYVELDAVQLDQLVAPIALDPDALVAQILTSSTYPDQVSAADSWLNQNMNLPPDQRASQANNMSWDPAVKGLIEFPAVLDMMTKNTAWTAQIGNAYFNQPGDVMNAIQAMRLQAQQSNVLVTTVHERVVVEAGLIQIVPVDPAVIYVPYYNPWRIWGSLFVAYPGFVVLPPPAGVVWAAGIGFDPAVYVGAYEGFGWGFGAWAPVWDGGVVAFGGDTYISSSTTVINHGYDNFGMHDRGAFDHDGRGVPHGYHPCAHAGAAHSRGLSARANHGRFGNGKPSPARSSAHNGATNGNHSAYGNRGMGSNHGTTNRGTAASNHGGMNRGGMNHGTSATNRGASPNRGSSTRASANRAPSSRTAANHAPTAANRSASANRGTSSANRGSTAANRGSSANRGTSSANRGAASHSTPSRSAANGSTANRSTANRGTSATNRGASANRGSSMGNRSSASANRGSANPGSSNRGSANRGSSNRGSANRGASANRGSSTASRGGSSMGNRGAAGGGNRGGSMASRGGSSAGHSGGNGGGHASGGHGRGR